MGVKANRYELLKLCMSIHDKVIVTKNADELLQSKDNFEYSLGYNMKMLSCDTYTDLKTTFETYS